VILLLCILYSVSQKNPPKLFWHFSPNVGIFLSKFYMPITRSYLRSTTNFYLITCNFDELPLPLSSHCVCKNVHHRSKLTLAFSDIFPKQLGIFSPNFTRLLYVPIYVRLPIFIQLSSAMTKLCHIKCDHPACVLADSGHFEHIMVVALNMA